MNKRLKTIFKEFESLQNKILIDYKRFRDKLIALISEFAEKRAADDSIQLKKNKIAEKLLKIRDSLSKRNSR